MTISAAYATTAEYKTAFSLTASTQDTRIASTLLAVSRHIERRTGRFFNVDAAVVERIYPLRDRVTLIDGLRALPTDDISTSTGLVVKQDDDLDGLFTDETAWTIDTDFSLYPLNAAQGPEATPWRAIVLPSWSGKSFNAGSRLSVTAKFGWAAVPAAIAQATLELAAIVMIDSPRATSRIQEGIEAVIGASPEAQTIVMRLVDTYGVAEVSSLAFS